MTNTGELALLHVSSRLQVEHHRGRGVTIVVAVESFLRQRHVHARRAHRLQARDRARQLALGGAAQIHPLGEFRSAEIAAVKELEAYAAAPRKPLRGQHEARLVDLRCWHRNGTAAGFGAKVDTGGLERGSGIGAVLGTKIRERVLIRGSRAEDDGDHGHYGRQGEHPRQQHACRCVQLGVALGDFTNGLEDRLHRLDPHTHDFVVRIDQLVAYSHRETHGHVGLFECQRHLVNVAGAAGDRIGLRVRRDLHLVDFTNRLAERAGEFRRLCWGTAFAALDRAVHAVGASGLGQRLRVVDAQVHGYFVMSSPRAAICFSVSTAVALASKARDADSRFTISLMGLTLGKVTKPLASASGWPGLYTILPGD